MALSFLNNILQQFGRRRYPKRTKRQLISMCFAEFLVAHLYVLMGCAVQCHESARHSHSKTSDFLPAVGYDRGFLVAMHLFSHVTKAHGNTAISMGAWILGHIKCAWIFIFFLGQIIGAFTGIFAVKFLTDKNYKWEGFVMSAKRIIECMSEPFGDSLVGLEDAFGRKDIKPPTLNGVEVTWRLYFTACIMEVFLSAILMMAYGAAYDSYSSSKNVETVSLRMGFIMYGLLNYKVEGFTANVSLNPIRSFVVFIANMDFRNFWIYLCPFVGTLSGAMLYGRLFRHEKRCIMIKQEHFQ